MIDFLTTDKIDLRREQSQACLNYAETMVNFNKVNRQQTRLRLVDSLTC